MTVREVVDADDRTRLWRLDDDQSIYRFRGASFAAFSEFDRRFSLPPRHDLRARAPGAPPRLRIEQNFRSFGHVLDAPNRLIGRNQARFEPDKRLRTDRGAGAQVEVVVCRIGQDQVLDADGVAADSDVRVGHGFSVGRTRDNSLSRPVAVSGG